MNLYHFHASYNQKIKEWLTPILESEKFIEYIAKDRKGLFVRIENNINDGDLIDCYLEPQLNLSRTIKDDSVCTKMQVTIIKKRYNSFPTNYQIINVNSIGLDVALESFTGCQFRELYKLIRKI